MRKFYYLLAIVAVAATSCQQEETYTRTQPETQNSEIADPQTRSYEEALAIAEEALKLVDGEDTRSSNHRVIKRNEGQVVMRPTTRGGETEEEPIMYIFNNENDEGFTVVAANRGVEPIIAVTERGNYTYGEPTGVEPFDKYMDDVVETYSTIVHPPIVLPDDPIVPNPGFIQDTIQYSHIERGPFLVTKWGQSGIYGAEAVNGLAGCGPTAIAQIMAYYQYPKGEIELTYGISSQTITLNWTNILRHYSGIGTNGTLGWTCLCGCNSGQVISKLLREIGHRAGATYNNDILEGDISTSTNQTQIKNGLVNFGYTASVHSHPTFDMTSWNTHVKSSIISDISNSRPLIICGYDNSTNTDTTGHAWVIDGYIKHDSEIDYYTYDPSSNTGTGYVYHHTSERHYELLHYNWGWNGQCDGWFSYACYKASEAEDYDDTSLNNNITYNFLIDNELIYNIKKPLIINPIW